jgi:hypothetical protein
VVIAAVREDGNFYAHFLEFLQGETDPTPPMSLKRRADFLYLYLAGQESEAAELVSFHWLLAGMPPDSAPGKPERWKAKVPGTAELIVGDENAVGKGQVWRLDCRSGEMWFAFDLVRGKRPVAVFQSLREARCKNMMGHL